MDRITILLFYQITFIYDYQSAHFHISHKVHGVNCIANANKIVGHYITWLLGTPGLNYVTSWSHIIKGMINSILTNARPIPFSNVSYPSTQGLLNQWTSKAQLHNRKPTTAKYITEELTFSEYKCRQSHNTNQYTLKICFIFKHYNLDYSLSPSPLVALV